MGMGWQGGGKGFQCKMTHIHMYRRYILYVYNVYMCVMYIMYIPIE